MSRKGGRAQYGALVVVVSALSFAALSASSESVQVLDESGKGIPHAELTVLGPGSRTVVADANGYANIPSPASKECRLSVAARGYRRATAPCPQGEANVVLRRQRVEDVLVRARRMSRPFAPTTLTQMEVFADPLGRADPLGIVNGLAHSTNTDSNGEVVLRGSAASRNRVYLDDVPLYEVVRGSSADRITRGRSILNPVVVKRVESYPMNTPLYLPNAAAGAVRLLPHDHGTSSTSVLVSLPALGATHSRSFGKRMHLQVFGGVDDMDAIRRLNSTLADTVRSWRGRDFGFSGGLRMGDAGKVATYNAFATENGAWPLHVLGTRGDFHSAARRRTHVLSYELPILEGRLKADFGRTTVDRDEQFGNYSYANENRYTYSAIDWAGEADFVHYRAGVAHEIMAQSSNGFAPAHPAAFGVDAPARAASHAARASRMDAFVYGVVAGEVAELQLGLRHSMLDGMDFTSVQAGVSLDRGHHRWIVSAGRYFAYDVSWAAYSGGLTPFESRQLGVDWAYSGSRLSAGAGVFGKVERTLATATEQRRIVGGDAFVTLDVRRDLSFRFSATRARVTSSAFGVRFPDENSIDYLVRVGMQWRPSPLTSIGVAYTTRNGTRYTPVTGSRLVAPAVRVPVFSSARNSARLSNFATLDLNFATRLKLGRVLRPLLFVGVTNALGRGNVRGIAYSTDFQRQVKQLYPGRTGVVGLVFLV